MSPEPLSGRAELLRQSDEFISTHLNSETAQFLSEHDWPLEVSPEEAIAIEAVREAIGWAILRDKRLSRSRRPQLAGWLARGPAELWRKRMATLTLREALVAIEIVCQVVEEEADV